MSFVLLVLSSATFRTPQRKRLERLAIVVPYVEREDGVVYGAQSRARLVVYETLSVGSNEGNVRNMW